MSLSKRFQLSILCITACALPAVAQEATLLGTVTDPSGAATPNVGITITNSDTGRVRKMTTGDNGQYLAPDLGIGHYTVAAEAQGFKTARSEITLAVGDRGRLDFKLELGNTQESVTVEATAIALQTESGEVSDVVSGQQVSQLATNGRSLYGLAALTPGASSFMPDFQNPTPVGGNASVSFNGQRAAHNIYLVDGGENLDRGGAGNISIMPSLDAIAEFRVLSSNYSAEFGLSSAGTLSMVFKSGTKQFHASAWEFLRNDALDAANFFTNAAGKTPQELRFNTYGFNVGGPVTIPKVYKTKPPRTFFFYNMEWRKLVQGGLVNQTVPPANSYGGVFSTPISVPGASQLSPSLLARYTALGLTPGQNFPNNTIPASLLDPNAQALLKAGIFPASNSGSQFIGGNKLPTNVREELVRIDHQFTDKFWIFGHYVAEQISQTYGTAQWSDDNVPTVGDTFGNPSYSGVIHATHAISPTLLNETAFNYNGNRINIVPYGVIDRPSSLNTPRLFSGPNNLNRIPNIDLAGTTGAKFEISSWPWHNKADDYQVRDDISWTKGRHQLKVGGSWALYKKIQDLFGQTQGAFNFNGAYTGNDFADFLLGYTNTYTELAVQDNGRWNNVSWAIYGQDNWRVNSRLTLNLGLRWDGIPHTYEENNRQSNFYPGLYDPAKAAIVLPDGNISPASPGLGVSPNPILKGVPLYLNGIGVAGQNGIPEGLVQNHWANFGPRVGFAYDLMGTGKTVIRGGFGIMYERIQGNDVYNAGPNLPFSTQVSFSNVSLSNPNLSLQSGQTLAAPISVASITGLAYSDYKQPASYQYSFGIQQQLMRNSVLSVAYVGNQNHHLNDYRDINLPNPGALPGLINKTAANYNTLVPFAGFRDVRLSENAANSHYHSLQVSLKAQASSSLAVQLAYTYSRAIDPNTKNNGGDLNDLSNPYNRAYDIGASPFDRSHIASINFVYEPPIFKSSPNRVLKSALGGWSLSGIVTAETGAPVADGSNNYITLGGAQGSNGLAKGTNRPNVNGPVTYLERVDAWFDKSALSTPAIGQWGNLGKGAIRGPGRDNWNLALFKSFVFSEQRGSQLEFRFETFNTFNHTQFKDVSTSFAASNFGAVTSAWDPRTLQLGLKLRF